MANAYNAKAFCLSKKESVNVNVTSSSIKSIIGGKRSPARRPATSNLRHSCKFMIPKTRQSLPDTNLHHQKNTKSFTLESDCLILHQSDLMNEELDGELNTMTFSSIQGHKDHHRKSQSQSRPKT